MNARQSHALKRKRRKRKNIFRKSIQTTFQKTFQKIFQRTFFLFFVCIFILSLSCVLKDESVDAHNDEADETPVRTKYYTSIEVGPGDSLWSIAERYADEDNETIHDYVDELKDINSLKSDKIHDGQYLTVSYYSL